MKFDLSQSEIPQLKSPSFTQKNVKDEMPTNSRFTIMNSGEEEQPMSKGFSKVESMPSIFTGKKLFSSKL